MVKGWAKEYLDEGIQQGMQQGMKQGMQQGMKQGMQQGLLTAKEMVLEALDIKFSSNVPEDIHKKINALNNRILLKRLLRSTFQAKDLDGFRKILQEIPPEQMQAQ